MSQRKLVSSVFGISNQVLLDSYVDRGDLDARIGQLLSRSTHIALRGESKCGKSWIRQKNISNALVVQCRLGRSVTDIYSDALSQLGVEFVASTTESASIKGRVQATGEFGIKLLAKAGIQAAIDASTQNNTTREAVGQNIDDLRFIADIIRSSGRRLVIEDFHYLSTSDRKRFSFDLKALWDYGAFVIIIGVWSSSNMLLSLNPDLTGRVEEVPITWSNADLGRVLSKGGNALGITFSADFEKALVDDCFGNVGILQALVLRTLDEKGITDAQTGVVVADLGALETAAMAYAEQLNPLYQQFADRVSRGIRSRTDSTGIYPHAMAAILEEDDDRLIYGVNIDRIFDVAHRRQPRIQKGNLRTVLEKFESLQVDDDGRGLVLSYNQANSCVSVVDRQLLLYRKYSTVAWPWEDLIREAEEST